MRLGLAVASGVFTEVVAFSDGDVAEREEVVFLSGIGAGFLF